MTDLLELPPALDGLPHSVRLDAFRRAEAVLPAGLAGLLGQARAEETLVAAAAHLLTVAGDGDTEIARPGGQTDRAGPWAGSAYGDQVAATLAQLPRQSGRRRQLIPT